MKKAKKINELDYVYASTRVKTAEGRGTLRDRLTSFAEAGSAEALVSAVVDSGIVSNPAVKTPSEAADAALVGAAELLRSSVPDPGVYDFLFYKYDCNNIKVALKESILESREDSRYFTCGTVSPSDVREAVFSPCEKVPVEQTLGRVLHDPGVPCPPAVPILMPGERVDKEAIDCFSYYRITELSVVK